MAHTIYFPSLPTTYKVKTSNYLIIDDKTTGLGLKIRVSDFVTSLNLGGSSTPDLSQVLAIDNTSGGEDIIMSAGDKLQFSNLPGEGIYWNSNFVGTNIDGDTTMISDAGSVKLKADVDIYLFASGGAVYYSLDNGSTSLAVDYSNITGNKTIQYPNKNGTFALLDDIDISMLSVSGPYAMIAGNPTIGNNEHLIYIVGNNPGAEIILPGNATGLPAGKELIFIRADGTGSINFKAQLSEFINGTISDTYAFPTPIGTKVTCHFDGTVWWITSTLI